ncbi:hypothetical protein ANRL3_02887 [Anaerolineae bacterium]|nr:hypothetical protein ANRL3_02887 [Anaerolineae bacterium]
MGALRLFASVVHTLHARPTLATQTSLDELAAGYGKFAYVGNRKTLSKFIHAWAKELQKRLLNVSDTEIERLAETNEDLASALSALKRKRDSKKFEMAAEWFAQTRWETGSGIFPDFLLGLDQQPTFGNGALLELKDSKGDAVASFNSTIPTRYKSLLEVKRISGSTMVAHAGRLFDYPLSAAPDYLSHQRACFYFVRTRSNDNQRVRLALVEGSFYETLPKEQLLEQVWKQILNASGMPPTEQPPIIEFLGHLEQTDIAQSREIEKASIRPRLRLMAEVHSDANLHTYPEIPARTVNLVLKREQGYDEHWVRQELLKEGFADVHVEKNENTRIILKSNDASLQLCYLVIKHKRNGEHIVLQYELF